MMDNTIPYLCGGIFFSLLNELKFKGTANDKFADKYEGISDVMLIINLHYVITGHEPITKTLYPHIRQSIGIVQQTGEK